MKFQKLLAVSMFAFVGGCAGSASHDVVSTYQSNDDTLSCQEVQTEIDKAQFVIDGVNRDKEDLTAADITDGILWFPFNLIAKNGNYNDAIQAADRRIAHLQTTKKERGCSVSTDGSKSEMNSASTGSALDRLEQLQRLYAAGALNKSEYEEAKTKVLSEL